MVSIGPYTTATDMRQMYDIRDLRGSKCLPTYHKNSLMDLIHQHPDMKFFSEIVVKANLFGILNDPQAYFTLFIPSDKALTQKGYTPQFFTNMDNGLARQIVLYSMMNREIDQKLLQSSPSNIFPTRDRSNSMRISTLNCITRLPGCTQVIHWDYKATNGIIHIVDNLLVPTLGGQ